ncbi:MAG: hypothetical protein CFE26_05915 [Verrucomicrobiales bacterium VVV1]|nr:MAG: hypothetical protein CFE26_05915 [Verrucomicrobiales bacterium VVV1]
MSGLVDSIRRYSAKRFAAGAMVCPSCLQRLPESVNRCPGCDFTGADTLALFPQPLPPLQMVLDAAGLWTDAELLLIKGRIEKLQRRFPQFHWSLYSLDAGEVSNLRLFGFWLLNASPLSEHETEEQRAWTILMVFNGASGKVALVPGYGAEPWVTDLQWQQALQAMSEGWNAGKRGHAVRRFFDASEKALQLAYSRVRRQLRRGN